MNEQITYTGYEISYFHNSNLLLLQFRPGSNDSKNRSELFSDSKRMRVIFFWRQRILEKELTYYDISTQVFKV